MGNHGVISGTVDFVDDGVFGKAAEFEEAGEVKCPYIELNDRSFTMCMWVNAARSGGEEQCVLTQMDNNTTNLSLHYRIYSSNGTVRMGFYSNDLDAPGAAPQEEWVHITYWFDADDMARKIYINGEQVASGATTSAYKGAKGDTIIGSWGTSGQRFRGLIDEVQIWGRALSEAEIEQSMQNLKDVSPVEPAGKLTTTWGDVRSNF